MSSVPKSQPVESDPPQERFLEIDVGRGKRLLGLVLYVLAFVSLCLVLMWFFVQLNTSLALAAGVVLFMVAYMLLMGWWAGRSIDQHQDPQE
jgi:hypothetical protein